jgi:uridine kinase
MVTGARQGPIDVEAVVLTLAPKLGTTRIIGIDGHGGSGKTTLAGRLAHTMRAETVHTDDFASWDNPKDWYPLLIEQVLAPVSRGATTLSYRRSQWWEGHKRDAVRNQPVSPIMILEGVSALRREFRPYLCFGIYVAASRDVCLRRGVARDKGFGTSEEISDLWQRYFSDEANYIARDLPEQYADLVVDGAQPFEHQVVLR